MEEEVIEINEEEIPNDELVVGYQFFEVELERKSFTSIWIVAKSREEIRLLEENIVSSNNIASYGWDEEGPEISHIGLAKHGPNWKYHPGDHFHIVDSKFFDTDDAIEILEEKAKERLEKLANMTPVCPGQLRLFEPGEEK
jgi:hypothetical protein